MSTEYKNACISKSQNNACVEIERKYKNCYFLIFHFQIYPKTVNKDNFP